MRIGFTGTRHGMTAAQRKTFWKLIAELMPDSFHHGSCKGADVQAARIVDQVVPDGQVVAHPVPDGDDCQEPSGADDEVMPGKTHFARNRDIVNDCVLLIACPLHMERRERGGTWYTVERAAKAGNMVRIVWPDGTVVDGRELLLSRRGR